MAICKLCGVEVAPIDKVLRFDGPDAVFFCTENHAWEWEHAQEAAKKAKKAAVAAPEAEIEPEVALKAEESLVKQDDEAAEPVKRRGRPPKKR